MNKIYIFFTLFVLTIAKPSVFINSYEEISFGSSIYGTNEVFMVAGGIASSNPELAFSKIGGDGFPIWSKKIEGMKLNSEKVQIKKTSDGFVIGGTTDSFHSGNLNMFILKFSDDGSLQWGKAFQTASQIDEIVKDLIVVSDGYVLIGANAECTHIIKVDLIGAILWKKKFCNINGNTINAGIEASDGSLLFTGWTKEQISSVVQKYIFILKLESTGELVWSKQIRDSETSTLYHEQGYSIIENSKGFFVAGSVLSESEIENGYVYICGFDFDGNLLIDSNGYYLQATQKGNYGLSIIDDGNSLHDQGFYITGQLNTGFFTTNIYHDTSAWNVEWTRKLYPSSTSTSNMGVLNSDLSITTIGTTNSQLTLTKIQKTGVVTVDGNDISTCAEAEDFSFTVIADADLGVTLNVSVTVSELSHSTIEIKSYLSINDFSLTPSSSCGCGTGNYLDASTCSNCLVNTYKELSGNWECSDCPSNSNTDGTGKTSINQCECAANFYWETDQCLTCPTDSTSSEGSIGILNCSCTANKYMDSDSCLNCPSGSTSASGSTEIDDCKCAKDTYRSGSSCVACEQYSYTVGTGETSKQACSYHCPVNMYYNGAGCSNCPSGSTTESIEGAQNNINICKCAKDTFLDGDKCESCPQYSFTSETGATDVSDCVFNCPVDTYLNSGKDECVSCPSGSTTEGETGKTEISQCKCEKDSFMDSGYCVSCPTYSFTSGKGALSITECNFVCPVDMYLNETLNGCNDCPQYSSTQSLDNQVSINGCKCISNTYMNQNSKTCDSCPAGSTNSNIGEIDISACKCAKDSFMNSNQCNNCPQYSYTSDIGAVSIDECNFVCPEDFYLNAQSSGCTECPINSTTESLVGAISLDQCKCQADSYFVSSEKECELCPIFSSTLGVTGATSISYCKFSCPINTYKAQNSESCENCPDYSSTEGILGGANDISICKCEINYYFNSTSMECIECPIHSSTNSSGAISIDSCVCEKGYAGNDANQCQICPIDTYSSVEGQKSCTQCGEFMTTNLIEGASSNDACQCIEGYQWSNSSTQCVKCPIDTFKNFIGNDECLSCPNYATTNGSIGTINSELCLCSFDFFKNDDTLLCEPCPIDTTKKVIGNSKDLCVYNGTSLEIALIGGIVAASIIIPVFILFIVLAFFVCCICIWFKKKKHNKQMNDKEIVKELVDVEEIETTTKPETTKELNNTNQVLSPISNNEKSDVNGNEKIETNEILEKQNLPLKEIEIPHDAEKSDSEPKTNVQTVKGEGKGNKTISTPLKINTNPEINHIQSPRTPIAINKSPIPLTPLPMSPIASPAPRTPSSFDTLRAKDFFFNPVEDDLEETIITGEMLGEQLSFVEDELISLEKALKKSKSESEE